MKILWMCCASLFFLHTPSKFSLTYVVSLETLGSPLQFIIKFCKFEQNVAAQHEFVMPDPLAGQLKSYNNASYIFVI